MRGAIGAEDPHVVAHSWGASIALAYLGAHHDRDVSCVRRRSRLRAAAGSARNVQPLQHADRNVGRRGSGHFPWFEQPSPFDTAFRDFFTARGLVLGN